MLKASPATQYLWHYWNNRPEDTRKLANWTRNDTNLFQMVRKSGVRGKGPVSQPNVDDQFHGTHLPGYGTALGGRSWCHLAHRFY